MTKQPNRIQVKETKEYFGDFEGSLESIIASLQNKLDDGWEGIQNECEPYEDYSSPYLYKHREENDKEYAKRMKELEKQKEREVQQLEKQKEREVQQKDKRRQEYDRLKKEFEDTP